MLTLALVLGFLLWLSFWPLPAGAPLDGGSNAIWIGHKWLAGKVSSADVDALADTLVAHRVRDVFVHVGPLDARGGVPEAAPRAWPLVRDRLRARGLRLFAWMGGVTAWSYGKAADTVDTADPGVRAGIVKTARALIDEARFDGVQLDLEIVPDGDAGFLALLDETHAALPRVPLSVAAPNLRPWWLLVAHLWSRGYYAEVGRRCDQVAVMAYDTGLPTATLYARYLRWEARALSETVQGPTLLFGVPTYDEATRSHRPSAETPGAALQGLSLAGVSFQGVAVYAEWTTSPEEWALLPH